MIVIATCMVVFLFIPFVDLALVKADPYVQNYVAQNGSLPIYSANTAICLIDPSPVPRLILLAVVPILFFATKDRVARTLVIIMLVCASTLCISPITALLSRFVTSIGLDRYEWLIPGGLVVAFWLNKLEAWVNPRLNSCYQTIFVPLVMLVLAFVLVYHAGWLNWRTRVTQLVNTSEPAKPTTDLGTNTWEAFINTASLIGESRAVTPTYYSVVAPTLWPFADLLIYNPGPNAENWAALDNLYDATDIDSVREIIGGLQIKYLLVPHMETLYHTLLKNSQGFAGIYQNVDVTVFKVVE